MCDCGICPSCLASGNIPVSNPNPVYVTTGATNAITWNNNWPIITTGSITTNGPWITSTAAAPGTIRHDPVKGVTEIFDGRSWLTLATDIKSDSIPEHSHQHPICACGCGCEADGDWHFNEKFCACQDLGCACVKDKPGEGILLHRIPVKKKKSKRAA